jgi:hypothetical protein
MMMTSSSSLWYSREHEHFCAPIQTKPEYYFSDQVLQQTDEELVIDKEDPSNRHHISETVSSETFFF